MGGVLATTCILRRPPSRARRSLCFGRRPAAPACASVTSAPVISARWGPRCARLGAGLARTVCGVTLGLRDRAILETLYSTGLRRMELSNLKLYEVETQGGRVFVRQGKVKKDRVIPIGERAADGWRMCGAVRERGEASACVGLG